MRPGFYQTELSCLLHIKFILYETCTINITNSISALLAEHLDTLFHEGNAGTNQNNDNIPENVPKFDTGYEHEYTNCLGTIFDVHSESLCIHSKRLYFDTLFYIEYAKKNIFLLSFLVFVLARLLSF